MRRSFRISLILFATAALAAHPASAAVAAEGPPGFTRTARTELAPGVTHEVYVRKSPPLTVHVARVSPNADARWRIVQASDRVGGGRGSLEPSSAMCRRIRCLLAVNADFFTPQGAPVGAVIADGEPVHSPNDRHHQLAIAADGTLRSARMDWTTRLVPTDLEDLGIDAINAERGRDEIVMYTPKMGPATGTNRFGSELVARIVHPGSTLRIGRTAVVRLESFHRASGNTAIPPDGMVLSGHGRGDAALARLWGRVASGEASAEALLRVTSDVPAAETVGGTPILLRDGKRWFADESRPFVRARAPRTAVGWTAEGHTLIVTIDGRQAGYSTGATLGETAGILRGLGARDAINLDGGGSTTFVTRGIVSNKPSDRLVLRGARRVVVAEPRASDRVLTNVERPVANVLALVIEDAPLGATTMAVAPPRPDGEITRARAADVASDPASGAVTVPTDGVARDSASTGIALFTASAAVLAAVWFRRSTRSALMGR